MDEISKIIKKYQIIPKKTLGQNFLINNDISKNIVKIANINDKNVIEIGFGLGSITSFILKDCKKLDAYEIDETLFNILQKELESPKLNLHLQDILKTNLPYLPNEKFVVIGNIPYYITTKIIFKLFDDSENIERVILMVQSDYAEKMLSEVNSKKYGKLAITTQFFGGIRKVLEVQKENFYPIPKINSTVIEIDFSKKIQIDDENLFIEFIKKCFFARRKTLVNNLKRIFMVDKILKGLVELGLNENVRPQELSLYQFLELWSLLSKSS